MYCDKLAKPPLGKAAVFYALLFQMNIKNGCLGLAQYFADDG